MDPDTESLLISTCQALGGFEYISDDINDQRQAYIMGDECLACLKDIKKFIKYYEHEGDNVVLTYLGTMGILEKDLVPIILLNTPANSNVRERIVLACRGAYVAVELIVPMTWPIDYKALEKLADTEEDNSIVGNLHQRLETLREYKRAFLQRGVLGAVFAVMLKPLGVEYRMRTTRDQAVIRLGLSLFRNLVAIPDPESSVSGTMDQFISSIMQEELLDRFQKENVMELLLTLASSSTDVQLTEWNAIALETFYHIFSGIDAVELIPAVSGQAKNSQLQDLLNKEEKEKKLQSTAGRKRHDRFGTTGEVRLQDGTRMVLHQKGALFTSFETQLDSVKKPRARTKRQKETDEYKKNMTRSGLAMLRELALTLLESGFNPLFTSLRQCIELERERVKDHHRNQYHYLMAFLLKFQRQYADYVAKQYQEQKKNAHPRELTSLEEEYKKNILRCDFDLVATAIETANVFQIVGFIRTRYEVKDKLWDDIRKAMNCIQEILMTLYAMSKSLNETYRDDSAIVQSNLYHEDATLELFLDLAKNYKKQSTKYLHTLVRMIHILLKTLENFSSSKSYMFIRKKRAIARRRKKNVKEGMNAEQQPEEGVTTQAAGEDEQPLYEVLQTDGGQEQDQEREDDEDQPTHTFKEHQFVFQEYERRFAHEHVISTYCAFLENFAELDETQMHWAASLFHRIAVNCSNLAVFYKLSTLHLFHQILQSNKEDARRDMIPFVSYVVHQFFKKMQEYPLLIAEVFFPKTSKNCLEINVGRDELEREKLVISEKKEKRLMSTELEVDPNRPESEQIKIAIMALLDEDEGDLVEWTIEILKSAVEKRQLMQFRSENELTENPDLMYSVENVEDIPVIANNPARQEALRLKPRFRLLFKLIKIVKEEEMNSVQYKIPKDLPTDTIAEYHDLIESIYKDEENYEQYDYSDLIKKINKPKKSNTGRHGAGVRQNAEKEMPVYHSAEYIIDSEDEDEAYFDAEKKLRERINIDFAQAEERQRRLEMENVRNKSQKQKSMLIKRSGGRKVMSLMDEEDEDGNDDGKARPPPKTASDVESDSDTNDDSDLRLIPKGAGDVGSEPESDNDESDNPAGSSRAAVPRQQYSSQRRTIRLETNDSDNGGDDEKSADPGAAYSDDVDKQATLPLSPTGPLSLTQRLAAQTSRSKRRIILDDSDDEDAHQSDLGSQGSEDGPAKKKFAFEE